MSMHTPLQILIRLHNKKIDLHNGNAFLGEEERLLHYYG